MFFLGSLSSFAPYLVMMLAYLFMMFSGINTDDKQDDDVTIAESTAGHISLTDRSSDTTYQTYFSCQTLHYQAEKTDVEHITPPDYTIIRIFCNAQVRAVDNYFIRFTFSLPPPVSISA
jgi:hypothetical protein